MCGKGGIGMATKAGGLTQSCAPIRRDTGKAPIKTGWAETDKEQQGKPNERARWVAKECKTHARPEYASTPSAGGAVSNAVGGLHG